MGEVYQARDTKLNRLVAVKILRPEQTRNKDLQRRFIQEAQAASMPWPLQRVDLENRG